MSSVHAEILSLLINEKNNGIFPGPIEHYMAGGVLLSREKLFERIDLTI